MVTDFEDIIAFIYDEDEIELQQIKDRYEQERE
jgi:hypothetical protein